MADIDLIRDRRPDHLNVHLPFQQGLTNNIRFLNRAIYVTLIEGNFRDTFLQEVLNTLLHDYEADEQDFQLFPVGPPAHFILICSSRTRRNAFTANSPYSIDDHTVVELRPWEGAWGAQFDPNLYRCQISLKWPPHETWNVPDMITTVAGFGQLV